MLPVISLYLQLMKNVETSIINNPKSLINRLFIIIVWASSILLRKIKKIEFPQRTIGGLWFVHRYRVEFCMEWLEPESVLWVRKFIKPGMNVVDIGAHIGYYTKIFSRLVKPTGRVYAFEASPENFGILTKNLNSYRNRNVIAYNNAASDKNEIMELHISPGHSNHSLVEGYTPSTKTVPIQAVRLDDHISNEKIDLIKIDVEGHELYVINGMRKLIQNSENLVMLVEYNPEALVKACPSPQNLLDLLNNLGFSYQAILDDGTLGNISEGTKTVNLLCTRKQII